MLYEENGDEVVVIDFSPTGRVTAIYDDELLDVLAGLGELRRPRASDINEDATGMFVADLSRVGGPILPGTQLKRDAERAEVAWLTRNVVGYVARKCSENNPIPTNGEML